jgi:hypothetical protein
MLDHPWNHSSFDRPEQEKAGDIGTEIMFELTATSSLFHDPPQRLSSRFHGKIHVSFTEGRDDDTASTLSASTFMDDDSVTDFCQVTSAKISVAAVHCQPNKTSKETAICVTTNTMIGISNPRLSLANLDNGWLNLLLIC